MNRPADITLRLPLPPSANKSWRPGITSAGVAAMFKRAPYKAWLAEAAWNVAAQRAGDCIPYRYHVRIVLPETRIDPDNAVKPLQDSCQRGGAITNDKFLRRLVLEVDPSREPDTALIELWATDDPVPKRRPVRVR